MLQASAENPQGSPQIDHDPIHFYNVTLVQPGANESCIILLQIVVLTKRLGPWRKATIQGKGTCLG